MMSAVIVASIAIAVILGYKTKINTVSFALLLHISSAALRSA